MLGLAGPRAVALVAQLRIRAGAEQGGRTLAEALGSPVVLRNEPMGLGNPLKKIWGCFRFPMGHGLYKPI